MLGPKIIATAVCKTDLWGTNATNKHQIRCFTAGQTYKVTCIDSHFIRAIDNNNTEHLCCIPGWGEQFNLTII